jgi:hypothetical protein
MRHAKAGGRNGAWIPGVWGPAAVIGSPAAIRAAMPASGPAAEAPVSPVPPNSPPPDPRT